MRACARAHVLIFAHQVVSKPGKYRCIREGSKSIQKEVTQIMSIEGRSIDPIEGRSIDPIEGQFPRARVRARARAYARAHVGLGPPS